jgi:hypothetical protein
MRIDLAFRGKFIGWIDTEAKIYFTKRTQNHYFFKFEGFGLSEGVLDMLDIYKIELIHFIIEDKIYEAKVSDFFVFGNDYTDIDDKQIILNKKFYHEAGTIRIEQEKLLI